MIILQYVVPFVLLIGILVFFHELGHFLAARACGMRADVFAIGMGPRLFGWNRKTGFTFGKIPDDLDLQGGTDYRLSAFPIGGYVKIAGMVDESMDTDFAGQEPKPWEFRSKNTFQKSLVISAGVIMNFLLAIVVLAGIYTFIGREVKATTKVGAVPATSPAFAAGVKPGDRIVSVNGTTVSSFEEIQNRLAAVDGQDIVLAIDRNGSPLTITVPHSTAPATASVEPFLYPEKTAILVSSVFDKSPADRGGLKSQDVIVGVNGTPVTSIEGFRQDVSRSAGKPMTLAVKRDDIESDMQVTPGTDGLIGVQIDAIYLGPVKRVQSSVGDALSMGYKETAFYTTQTFAMVGRLFTGKAKLGESVGGPLMIAKLAKKQAAAGIGEYLRLLALISVALACMNILPIPALDGGHLVFILVEGVIRREVPMKVRVAIQQVGFALLLLFFVFVFYSDATKLFTK
jgi:regulator of sigma E protease